MISTLRQWLFPKEFRIDASRSLTLNISIEDVISKLEGLIKQSREDLNQGDAKFIKAITNSVWRMEKRVNGLPSDSSSTRVKTALKLIKDVLRESQIELIDYTGERWGPRYEGMAFDGVGGNGGVIKMVEPRILHNGRFLQKGKIILE